MSAEQNERAMVRESAAMQDAILKVERAAWCLEDRLVVWRIVAAMGWGAFLLMVWLMNSLLNDLKHERGIKTSERSGGNGVVSLRVRGDVAADNAALRGDPVQVPSAGVVVAPEEERAVGGVSTSGIYQPRINTDAHGLNLPSGWNATGGRDAGMEAGTGVAVAGVAAAPFPKSEQKVSTTDAHG